MYSRDNFEWLYLYYSGEKLEVIAKIIKRSPYAVKSRIKYMKLPTRPHCNFTEKVKLKWLKEPHIVALRRLFKERI